MAEGKLTYQHANAEEKPEPAKKRRREAARVEHTRTVAEHFKPADVSSVKEVWPQFVDFLNVFSSIPSQPIDSCVVKFHDILIDWFVSWIVTVVFGHKDDITRSLWQNWVGR